MTLLIKNGGYAFFIRLGLMLSMSLWKQCQLLQILNDLSIKHLSNLIWKWWKTLKIYEKACKCEILIIDTWNENIKKNDGMVNLFFYHKFNVRMPFI